MKKKYLFTVLLLISALVAYADDQEGNKEKPAETKSTPSTPAEPKKNNNNPLKEFVPSEEISVDRPVAFPVDI
jgi:hypothetical protein